ncbi:MAG: aminopeptidase, partial [Enterobacter hormaechei]|nr:aminopeptidase [Enterobacter hormaechei]
HGHCAASIADEKDIHHTQQLLVALVAGMNRETVDHLTDFRC